jgi:hypothetical protein
MRFKYFLTKTGVKGEGFGAVAQGLVKTSPKASYFLCVTADFPAVTQDWR